MYRRMMDTGSNHSGGRVKVRSLRFPRNLNELFPAIGVEYYNDTGTKVKTMEN